MRQLTKQRVTEHIETLYPMPANISCYIIVVAWSRTLAEHNNSLVNWERVENYCHSPTQPQLELGVTK